MGKKIYVAGPLGFSAPGRFYMENMLMPALAQAGFAAVDPFKLTDHSLIDEARASRSWWKLNQTIFSNNVDAICAADAVVAVLDGSDVDSGTASEIGFAYAKGKAVFGLRTDFRLAGDNPGAIVNLQVQGFVVNGIYGEIPELVSALKVWRLG
jgi:nucleoside 2-deoxyribosyltransferase